MPPESPGIGIRCTTSPTRCCPEASTRTMRMSFLPRPADSVHRYRPSTVNAPPIGRLPSLVSLPTGSSFRPLGWMRLSGPMRPGRTFMASTAAALVPSTAATPSSAPRLIPRRNSSATRLIAARLRGCSPSVVANQSSSADCGRGDEAPSQLPPFSDARFVQEGHDLAGAALRLVLEGEVAGVLDQDELRARDLLVEPVSAPDRGEVVVRAPEDQRRDSQRREAALVWDELLEVPRAVELELAAASLLGGVRLPVLVDGRVVEAFAHGPQPRREGVAVEPLERRLADALGAKRLRQPVPPAVGKEPGVADDEPAHGLRVIAGPAHADRTAPVVDNEHDVVEVNGAAKLLHDLH